jgi:hypothetical protein
VGARTRLLVLKRCAGWLEALSVSSLITQLK